MNNRNIIFYILLIVILGAVAYFLLQQKGEGDSTLEDQKWEYQFAVKDTAAIDRIVLSDKTPSRVTLERRKDGWYVNGQYPARQDAVDVLLRTFHRMRMRNFVPQSLHTLVENRMSVYGTDVKIFQDGKLVREFTVGTDADDEMATYMKIKGASQPYAVDLPGFNGILSTRFFTREHLWKKRVITQMDPRQIREVRLHYPDSAASGFVLKAFEPDSMALYSYHKGERLPFTLSRARLYLGAVSRMRYEGEIIPSDPIYQRQDSLRASSPVFSLEVIDRQGEKTTLTGYRIKGPEEALEEDQAPPEFDPDRLHAFINDDQMVLVQYYALRRVLLPASYFAKGEPLVKNN